MKLVNYNSGSSLNLLDDFFNRSIADFFGADFANNIPAINVIENADSFRLEIAAPGLEKKDFEVKLENKYLSVSANKKIEDTVEKSNYKRREFNFTSFNRRFRLPEGVTTDDISATYENGILKLILPKNAKSVTEDAQLIEIK